MVMDRWNEVERIKGIIRKKFHRHVTYFTATTKRADGKRKLLFLYLDGTVKSYRALSELDRQVREEFRDFMDEKTGQSKYYSRVKIFVTVDPTREEVHTI